MAIGGVEVGAELDKSLESEGEVEVEVFVDFSGKVTVEMAKTASSYTIPFQQRQHLGPVNSRPGLSEHPRS